MKIRSFSVLFDMCLDFIRGLADLQGPVINKSKLLWVTLSTSQGPKNRHLRTWQGISNCQCARFYFISNKRPQTCRPLIVQSRPVGPCLTETLNVLTPLPKFLDPLLMFRALAIMNDCHHPASKYFQFLSSWRWLKSFWRHQEIFE